jgi:hypothetical protein
LLLVLAAACKGDAGSATPPPAPPGPAQVEKAVESAAGVATSTKTCELQPFEHTTPVPEASAAAWMPIDGHDALVVTSDSGDDGAYAIVDPDSGKTLETGKLPLGAGASDDTEGMSAIGDRLYGLTSSGWMRVWQRKDKAFVLVDGPYPIGEVVDSPKHAAPAPNAVACPGPKTNCGRNYEGLCLAPPKPLGTVAAIPPACAGFAAAKGEGKLYCLTLGADGRYAAQPPPTIDTGWHHDMLADCAFAPDGALYVAANMFALGDVQQVTGWEDPATAKLVDIGPLAIGFPETLAVRGDSFYRMSDMNGAPSLMAKWRCKR